LDATKLVSYVITVLEPKTIGFLLQITEFRQQIHKKEQGILERPQVRLRRIFEDGGWVSKG
jgi:hypothetical protein